MTSGPPERKHPPQQSISIKVADDVAQGVYANKVIISHSPDEFIFDFVADFPPGAQIVARVITAPGHASALLEAMQDNVAKYESKFGRIKRHAPSADA